jgi:hypothetical protein
LFGKNEDSNEKPYQLMLPRYPPTDEVFFVQNAGATAAGTGLNKSNIIQKISLSQVAQFSTQRNASGDINVTTVNANPTVVNSNGVPKMAHTTKLG